MKVVIIGGDAAGMSAAMEIVRNVENAQIVVLERGDIYSYGQCGLPYVIDGRVSHVDNLIARSVTEFRDKYNIDARTSYEVTEINSSAQVVKGFDRHTGKAFEQSYDKLLIATGASPVMPDWPGSQLEGIHHVKTIPHMEQLLTELPSVKRATVIGGGYIGLEVTEALSKRGVKVTLIERTKHLLPALHDSLATAIYNTAIANGVDVRLNETVLSFTGDTRVASVETTLGKYETDLVIVSAGVRPNTQFAHDFNKLPNGALIVNEKMESSIPHVFAAGDCASHFHRLKGADDYVPLGTTANKQGRIAGRVIAGLDATFNGIVGTSILQFFELQIGMTGISVEEATALEMDAVMYDWETNAFAGYYETPPKLKFHIVIERISKRLLGLQMIGEMGVDKRIDVFATALYNGMTLPQLLDVDISYSPPFNGVWDPLQQVAKRYS